MKLLYALILAALLAVLSPVARAGDITYEGLAGDLVYLPDHDWIPMSLFYGCKALSAGSSCCDRVRLSGSLNAQQEMILYLYADGLRQSGLTLEIRGMGGRQIFYGTPEKDSWIYLGSYENGEGETLTLRLTAGKSGGDPQLVSWHFLAVERPPEADIPFPDYPPVTGDDFPLSGWAAVLIASGFSLAVSTVVFNPLCNTSKTQEIEL